MRNYCESMKSRTVVLVSVQSVFSLVYFSGAAERYTVCRNSFQSSDISHRYVKLIQSCCQSAVQTKRLVCRVRENKKLQVRANI